MKIEIKPGTCIQVVAGIRHDWLERLGTYQDFPYLPEIGCKVSAVVLRVKTALPEKE